jgi:polyhydroxybutyrate depolymerase
VVHGAFDDAKGMEKVTGFSELADRENFFVLYPNGISLFGFLRHWNAGHCCGKAADDEVDDVGFITETIEDACLRLNVDRCRIYMVGFSNGGMMAYRFAAEKTHLLAAVAPLAASLGGSPTPEIAEWRIPIPKYPIPLLTMHGSKDEDIPFHGGVSPRRGGNRTYWSVANSIGFWVKNNQCREVPLRTTSHNGQVQVTSWRGCSNDCEVLLYEIKDWGHTWPGKYFTRELDTDHPLRNFDAKEIVWEFFKKYSRNIEFP